MLSQLQQQQQLLRTGGYGGAASRHAGQEEPGTSSVRYGPAPAASTSETHPLLDVGGRTVS